MNRELDGIYFMVSRDGKRQPICFTDMTKSEIDEVIGERSAEWWKSAAMRLKEVINEIGDTFDIVRREDNEAN